jgi:hypothetical protein
VAGTLEVVELAGGLELVLSFSMNASLIGYRAAESTLSTMHGGEEYAEALGLYQM